jgi:hypothetical protein
VQKLGYLGERSMPRKHGKNLKMVEVLALTGGGACAAGKNELYFSGIPQ